MSQAVLIWYFNYTDPLEGDKSEYPPNQKLVGIWDISNLDRVSYEDVQDHSPKDADIARIYYISLN